MRDKPSDFHVQSFSAQREWTVDGIPVLSASVELPAPEPERSRVCRRIRRYYQLQCRAFLRYCEHWLLPQAEAEYRLALASSAPLPCFRAELTYQITYHEGRLWSLYTQSREQTLPGQTLMTRRGDTWDLAAGYPIALQDFFPRRTPWRRQLLSCAAAEIQRQERIGLAQYHEDWRKRLRRAFNSQNFYLTAEGLAFFFPMFSIAPAVERVPTFLLPYGDSGPNPHLAAEKDTAS